MDRTMMPAKLPSHRTLLRAVDIYLGRAFEIAIPKAALQRVDDLRKAGESWSSCAAVENDKEKASLAIRLGNRFYPHMKLVIAERPDKMGCFFRADSHDAHVFCSPEIPEYAAILTLRKNNQVIASAIEADWENAGLATSTTYWKEGVARLLANAAEEQTVAKIG
jgi:hypothetical protein